MLPKLIEAAGGLVRDLGLGKAKDFRRQPWTENDQLDAMQKIQGIINNLQLKRKLLSNIVVKATEKAGVFRISGASAGPGYTLPFVIDDAFAGTEMLVLGTEQTNNFDEHPVYDVTVGVK